MTTTMKRRTGIRGHNGSANEDLECILNSLTISTLQQMNPVIKWMEDHYNWSNYQNFHWLIRQVLDEKLELKEEEESPIQHQHIYDVHTDESEDDKVFEPSDDWNQGFTQFLTEECPQLAQEDLSVKQDDGELDVESPNSPNVFKKVLKKYKSPRLNKNAKPFTPSSQRLSKVIEEGSPFQYIHHSVVSMDLCLFEIKKVMDLLNQREDKSKIDTAMVINFMKQYRICWDRFKDSSQKKKFCASLKAKSKDITEISMSTIQSIWDQMNAIYAEWKQNEKILRFNDNSDLESTSTEKSMIYISEEMTMNMMAIVNKYFDSNKDLFHYLRWRIKMQQIDGLYKIYKNGVGFELILFNVNLVNNDGERLFIVGIRNDKILRKHETSWKMIGCMTPKQIQNQWDIDDLPIIQKLQNNYDKHQMMRFNPNKFMNLRQIKTPQRKQKKANGEYEINCNELHELAMHGINNNHSLIPVISFNKYQTEYFVNCMLPIQLKDNNWIGLIFRNNEIKSIGIDCDDIKNKAKLYDITFEKKIYEWMDNHHIQRLKVFKPKLSKKMNKKYL